MSAPSLLEAVRFFVFSTSHYCKHFAVPGEIQIRTRSWGMVTARVAAEFLASCMRLRYECSMKLFGPRHIHRNFLLPLLVAVSVFLVSQAISLPSFANPQKAKLSKLHEVKQTCVVVKNQHKYPKSRIVKTAPFFDLCSKAECDDHPTSPSIAFDLESRSATSVLPSAVLPRAPPA